MSLSGILDTVQRSALDVGSGAYWWWRRNAPALPALSAPTLPELPALPMAPNLPAVKYEVQNMWRALADTMAPQLQNR